MDSKTSLGVSLLKLLQDLLHISFYTGGFPVIFHRGEGEPFFLPGFNSDSGVKGVCQVSTGVSGGGHTSTRARISIFPAVVPTAGRLLNAGCRQRQPRIEYGPAGCSLRIRRI